MDTNKIHNYYQLIIYNCQIVSYFNAIFLKICVRYQELRHQGSAELEVRILWKGML